MTDEASRLANGERRLRQMVHQMRERLSLTSARSCLALGGICCQELELGHVLKPTH